MNFSIHHSPVGPLLLVGDSNGLCQLNFPNSKKKITPEQHWVRDDHAFEAEHQQLTDYFDGRLKQFDLKLNPQGTTFQKKVWKSLLNIEYGETSSYGALAKEVDSPKAARAVGAANGANPISIIVPCHRVIGVNGQLTGFGGGLPTKQWLLAHERGERSLFAFDELLPT